MSEIELRDTRDFTIDDVLPLYRANEWSWAKDPVKLLEALRNSHSVVTAWDASTLVGLGNAITDGWVVVYYPHLLVHPDYHRRGIGRQIISRLTDKFAGFHTSKCCLPRGPSSFTSRAVSTSPPVRQ
tara:strand:- start:1173 stop:1553 length:381 start_codon:yes stop_codon:yes gene_type:complete